MAKQVQLRRGTKKACDAFVGAQGEMTYTTDDKHLAVHDGVTPGGTKIPNEEDTIMLASNVAQIACMSILREFEDLEDIVVKHIEYLELKRDFEDGFYKYVKTEGDGENAVSVTYYSWLTPKGRVFYTMEDLIKLDQEEDAKKAEFRLPDESPLPPCTAYQTRIPQKCRLINYPDDLLPITDKENELWGKLKQIQDSIKETREVFGITDEEDSDEENAPEQ